MKKQARVIHFTKGAARDFMQAQGWNVLGLQRISTKSGPAVRVKVVKSGSDRYINEIVFPDDLARANPDAKVVV